MVIWVLIGAGAWTAIALVAVAMCRLAALGDATVIFDDSQPVPMPAPPIRASRRTRRVRQAPRPAGIRGV